MIARMMEQTIDKREDGDALRHTELASHLRNEIADGLYDVGERFPTELELKIRFGVGRHTVREALKVLVEEGLIHRRRKLGSVVTSTRPVAKYLHGLRDLRGLLNFAHASEFTALEQGIVTLKASANVAAVDAGRHIRIAGLRRLIGNSQPSSWTEYHFPERYAEARSVPLKPGETFFARIVDLFAIRVDHIEQTASAIEMPAETAALLEVPEQKAALMIIRRYVEAGGVTFLMTRNVFPGGSHAIQNIFRER